MEASSDAELHASASAAAAAPLRAPEVGRLREEQEKVVTNCQEKIQHWKKVDSDYTALQERLSTLPDKLSYNVMVPFGPFAFMPGKLVHTNEVTVLLGDNWFAKCSAKQAAGLVEHRKERRSLFRMVLCRVCVGSQAAKLRDYFLPTVASIIF